MNHLIKKTGFWLILFAFLTACSPLSYLRAQPDSASSTSIPPDRSIQLQPCQLGDIQAQCGTLKVFENRSTRTGRMIDPMDARLHQLSSSVFRKAIEDTVIKDISAVNRQTPGMTQCVHRHIHIHMIHAEAIMGSAVDGETASEPVGFFINWPVHFRSERMSQAVRRHHGAEHAKFGDGAAQLTGKSFTSTESMVEPS